MDFVHYTVMGDEVLQHLVPPHSSDLLIDATLGEGGHSLLFLERYPELRVLGLDADAGILERAKKRLAKFQDRVSFEHIWFDEYFASGQRVERPALILLDLGISTYHFTLSGRGFSFQADEPLDMRLNASEGLSAADLVNSSTAKQIADLLFHFGEERYSRRIAERIVRERAVRTIRTSGELADIVSQAVPAEYRHGRIHPATRTFQALRIAVNGELERLSRTLGFAVDVLAPGGRIGVIAFHSLEDRIVKNVFRDRSKGSVTGSNRPNMKEEAEVRILTKKPLRPSEAEVQANAASRSAKLRVAEKVSTPDGGEVW
ncbi:MAG TPA: 16S rRNA (cytosine(1402)-N(4))-methyltransferase RsmH [Spirochaetia bacterium]|nr:16S rRNA (cytosine(1402)-N(4))-methyltransferase RsmH [Spirochaetia bacterium]